MNLESVKSAIREKLERTGRSYSHADALVEAALSVQQDEEGYSSSEDNGDSRLTGIFKVIKNNISSLPNEVVQKKPELDQETPKKITLPLKKSISLEEENRLLREARLCKICMDAEVGIVFLPCGHLTTCVNCAPNLEDCPLCRCAIKATVRTFLS